MNQRLTTPRNRIRTTVISLGVTVALTAGWISPAVAAPVVEPPESTIAVGDETLSDSPQLSIEGTVLVVVVEAPAGSRAESASTPTDPGTQYWVNTPQGESIAITGDLAGVATGSLFDGTVALPEAITDRVSARFVERIGSSATDPVDHESAAGTQLIQLAAADPAPLQVVAAQVTVPVAAAASSTTHTVDIAIVNGDPFSNTEVNTLVAGLSSFWVGQSVGKITSVSRPAAPVRYTSLESQTACDFNAIWDEAAGQFGKSAQDYWGTGASAHLVVISPDNCGVGLGTVGQPGFQGGLVWMSPDYNVDLHTGAHEFGHNLGLGHSNVHQCGGVSEAGAEVEGTPGVDGCLDWEYEDFYDVMSAGVYGSPNTNHLPALNATHKRTLEYYRTGELVSVTSTTTTPLPLLAASATAGIRALRVTDPFTGDNYLVELRTGTGMDAGAFYAQGTPPAMGLTTGVRILKTRVAGGVDDSSVVFEQALQSGDGFRHLALDTGESFTSANRAVTIRVVSRVGETATISVVLTPRPTVDRISGADRYAVSVNVSLAAFPTNGSADVVYVATGNNYPDALSAAPAAVREGGPLLLTSPSALPTVLRAEIVRLDPTKIVVVGGVNSVTPAVFSELQAIALTEPHSVIRINGADRYAASLAVNQYAFAPGGSSGPVTSAYVVTGTNFPDALSAGAAGASFDAPVVLVYGPGSTAGEPVTAFLDELGVTTVKVGGGVNSVTPAVFDSLRAPGRTVQRFAGADRFIASQNINIDAFDPVTSHIYLATGYNYPDALAGAALAGKTQSPLYVVQPGCIPRRVLAEIGRLGATQVTLLGGPNSLSAGVLNLTPCSR